MLYSFFSHWNISSDILVRSVTMNKYKYQISSKTDQEIWVCEACKKANTQLILTGKWKLIDRRNNAKIPCGVCGADNIATVKT